jgi:Mce-associated membrane protein
MSVEPMSGRPLSEEVREAGDEQRTDEAVGGPAEDEAEGQVAGQAAEEAAEEAGEEADGQDEEQAGEEAAQPAREPIGRRIKRGGRSLLFGRAPVALTAALAVLLVAVGGWALVTNRQAAAAHRVAAASATASSAATQLVPKILSYNYHTLAQDLATAEGVTTGPFTARYHSLFTGQIEAAAAKQGIVTNADVVSTSVVSAAENKVVALVYIDQTTTQGKSSTPKLDSSRALVTLVPVGPRWLISAVAPV